MYTFVTSLNQEYWKSTSKTNLLSWDKYLSDSCEIVIYTEDNINLDAFSNRVTTKDLYKSCPQLLEFKEKYKDNPHYNGQIGRKLEGSSKAFKWNAIKFAHKTFAIFAEAKQQVSNTIVWLDADVLMHQPVTDARLSSLFPQTKAISYLGRPDTYDECGLMSFNLNLPFSKIFLEKYENEYKNGLEHLRETHDSWIFFQLRLGYEDQSMFHNLNPTPKDNKSPFNNSGINEFMVHTKGKNKERLQHKFMKRFLLQEARGKDPKHA